MNKLAAYYGDENFKVPEQIMLQAGQLSLIYQDGIIRSIRFGSHEIIQRIYMALRDKYWNTISNQISIVNFHSSKSDFQITFKSVNKFKDIHFMWRGEIVGFSDSSIHYSMHGEAISTFERNRIGLCVLHPLELCTGRACSIETTDGKVHHDTFPVFIKPHQTFKNIRQINYKIPSEGMVCISFEGDIFEMEDQRNWTDASFKTYSTPLSEPTPAIIEKGSKIEQSVTVKISAKTSTLISVSYPKTIEIRLPNQTRLLHSIPRIGISHNINTQLNPFSIEMLQQLSLTHVRFELYCDDENCIIPEMEKAANICSLLGTPSELALFFSENYESEIQLVSSVLRTSQIPVSAFLIYRKDLAVTPVDTILRVAPVLNSYSPGALIGSGTDSYFVNLNRIHPPNELLDLICYSATPQVHTFDNEAIMINIAGLAETLRTAALFQGKAHPAISPLSLYPRINKLRPEKSGGADTRQKGLFGACWALGSLVHCIEGGVESITFFESAGPSGIMPFSGATVYPIYHVIASFTEMNGAVARSCICNDPDHIASIALIGRTSFMLLIANLTNIMQQVTIFDLPDTVSCISLNENTIEESMVFPQQWRCKKGTNVNSSGPFHIFDILPYSILRIEAPLVF